MEVKGPLLDGFFLLCHVSDYLEKSLLRKTPEPYRTCDYHVPHRGARLQREMEELSEEKEEKAKKSGPGSNCGECQLIGFQQNMLTEHWGEAGQRQMGSFVLTTLLTQSLMRSDCD